MMTAFGDAGGMSTQQKSNTDQSLTFEDISKFFSLPLSEAADILGVSTGRLKTICSENGLERWPHRKYLAGKSIEDIKIEAAKEKSKAGMSKADKQKSSTASTVSSTVVSQSKDKPSRPVAESPKSLGTAPQSASKNVYTWRSQSLLNSGLVNETSIGLDEFKHGFPSNGLSTHTNKWWGSGSPGVVGNSEVDSGTERANGEEAKQDKVSLSALRKQAVEEARELTKLGLWKEHGVDNLGKNESILLYRIFRNS